MASLRYAKNDQHGFIEIIFEALPERASAKLSAVNPAGDQIEFGLYIENNRCKSVFFNSYFLDDGYYDFELILMHEVVGEAVEPLAGQFRICNGSSNLASSLRHAFRANPQCALSQGPLDSSYFDFLPDNLKPNNYPFQMRESTMQELRVLSDKQIASFDQTGTLILESFFDEADINAAKKVLSSVNDNELFGFSKGSSQRIVNLHESYEELNRLYSNKKLYDVVSDLFGVQAFPCQSLSFINGSTQDAHQDTVHLTPFPRGLMCGIWIAIEDVVQGAGELVFYPGSHTLPAILCSTHQVPKVDSEDGDYSHFGTVFTPLVNELLSTRPELESEQFIAKAGDVLIWQENLIHGGAPRTIQDQTRMSMVIHAFGEPALIYYDSLGMSGKRDTALVNSSTD